MSYSYANDLTGTLITPWHGADDVLWNRSQLVPIKFKNGPSYVKHTTDKHIPLLLNYILSLQPPVFPNKRRARGPMGHILDTAIRCFRAIRVQLPSKGKFAKLRPSLEKYLHFSMEHFLIIMTGCNTKVFTWSSTAVKIAT